MGQRHIDSFKVRMVARSSGGMYSSSIGAG
jgi:hypothetical protein